MTDLSTGVNALFDRYLSAWNAHDLAGIAACYTEPSLFILPGSTLAAPDRKTMIALMQHVFAGLEADGFSHSEIGTVTARACGPDLAVADARDVRRLRRDGSVLEVIDAHYTLRRVNGAWAFVTATVCTPGWREA